MPLTAAKFFTRPFCDPTTDYPYWSRRRYVYPHRLAQQRYSDTISVVFTVRLRAPFRPLFPSSGWPFRHRATWSDTPFADSPAISNLARQRPYMSRSCRANKDWQTTLRRRHARSDRVDMHQGALQAEIVNVQGMCACDTCYSQLKHSDHGQSAANGSPLRAVQVPPGHIQVTLWSPWRQIIRHQSEPLQYHGAERASTLSAHTYCSGGHRAQPARPPIRSVL